MKKILTIITMMLVLATAAFAKPVTVEYYDGLTFETDTSFIGKTAIKSNLIDIIEYNAREDDVTIDYIVKVDLEQDMRESDKAFFEELLSGPYARVWMIFGNEECTWFVTDTKEVYYVEFVRK